MKSGSVFFFLFPFFLLGAIFAMGPIGNILCIAIIVALFARNLMGPTRA